MRLGPAAYCSMDDAKNCREAIRWVTCATILPSFWSHWPSPVTDPCAAAAMHNDASPGGVGKVDPLTGR
jgi:hypothetical protein